MEIRTGYAKVRRSRSVLPGHGRPEQSAVTADHGIGCAIVVAQRFLREAHRPEACRSSVRQQPGCGAVEQVVGANQVDAPLSLRMAQSFLGLRSPSVYTLKGHRR